MANEFGIINNPTSTPEAVSTGYQRQNTRAEAASNGVDLSAVEISGSNVKIKVSGPVDVNGVLYNCSAETTLTPGATGFHYIYLTGSGVNLTPLLTQNDGTYIHLKNARYTASNERILNWIIYNDGSSLYLNKLNQLNDDYITILQSNIPDFIIKQKTSFSVYQTATQTTSLSSPVKLTFDTSVFDTLSEFDLVNERFICTYQGYYNFNTSFDCLNTSLLGGFSTLFYKNGILYKNCGVADIRTGGSMTTQPLISVNALIPLVPADYVEIFVQKLGAGGTLQISNKYFEGYFI